MRVLVVVAAKVEELHRARQHLGYERLVLVAPEGQGEALVHALLGVPAPAPDAPARPLAVPGHIRVEEVPAYDLLACLERIEGLLRAARKEGHEVRAAVDGGTAAMSEAAFLACLSEGVEAWFLLHKVMRLPVLRARSVAQRFDEDERAVLGTLQGKLPSEELAARLGRDGEQVKRALLHLRKQGIVASDSAGAELTELGRYLQRGLVGSGLG
jgi:hypothetical protein